MGARATQRYRRWAGRVRGWPVWELPRWLTVFVAVTTAAYVAVIAIAGSQTDFRLHDIALFALLLAFGAASIELTRRSGESAGLSMDVYGVWQLPIALLLPPAYVLIAPISKLAFTQWRTRHTVVHRRIFTASAVGLAYGAASWVFHQVTAGYPDVTPGPGNRWIVWIAVAAACALLRWAIEASLVLTAVKGSDPAVSVREMQFTREPLYNDLAELSIGLAAATLIADNWFLIALFLPAVTLLQRSLRHAQLENASRVDAKTGLLNAAAWQREARVEISRAARTRTPLAVAMVDIDHFKLINDTYGHLAGDAVLAALSAAMRGLLRDYDVVGRFGGEEFIILLPHTSEAAAHEIAERLRTKLAQISVTPGKDSSGDAAMQVTVSIGIACLGQSRRDLDDLIAAADAALYYAKETGRNQVRMAIDPSSVSHA